MREKEVESERGKSKVIVVRWIRVTPYVVEMNEEIMEVVSPLMYLESCFSKDGRSQEDIKMRVGEAPKTFGALKMPFKVRSVSSGVKRELYESCSTNGSVRR